MPVPDAKSCVAASLPGYAGIDNDLFYKEIHLCFLLMQMTEDITKNL